MAAEWLRGRVTLWWGDSVVRYDGYSACSQKQSILYSCFLLPTPGQEIRHSYNAYLIPLAHEFIQLGTVKNVQGFLQ